MLSSVFASSPMLAVCGPEVTFALTNLKTTMGTVKVSNDADKLYITYAISDSSFFISNTQLAIARTLQSIPQTKSIPNPWLFPYSSIHSPALKSFTYAIPLKTLGFSAGQKIVVAAMAGVVRPKTSNWSGAWEWTVAWGIGNLNGTSYETIHNYTISACNTPTPPPTAPDGGIVTITFDDGWAETYTKAYPVLKQLGLRGNMAVNNEPIDGGWSAYMTLAQVKEMHAAGWSVVSHSVSHRDLTTLTAAELEKELADSKAWIARNGFGSSPVFIVPFHSWGPRERAAIQRHYGAARGYTATQFFPELFVKVPITQPYDLSGYESEYAPFTTPEGRTATMGYVERAVKDGEFIDLFFHHITDAQLPAFRLLMQQVAQYKANIRTYNEVF